MNFIDMSEVDFNEMILIRIRELVDSKKLKQSYLAQKSNISQSTLSKVMSGETKLTMQHIFKLCKALEITPSDLFATDDTKRVSFDSILNEMSLINDVYLNKQILIKDPKHPSFKGYIDNEFYFYCYPTISSETTLLEGKLSFVEDSNQTYCKAKLCLYTGKIDYMNNKITKEYHGEMIISLTMGVCYCLLINSEIGEICTFSFKHTFLFTQTSHINFSYAA
uniref:helix-turn-helix domain-containing protein n=1 Tax=Agathobacter sp. TaxID=2021311 RepID=UPI004057AA9F